MNNKEQYVRQYLEARSLFPGKEEWKRMCVFMREYEQARGDTPAEELAEKVVTMLKGERSFLNHLNHERMRYSRDD